MQAAEHPESQRSTRLDVSRAQRPNPTDHVARTVELAGRLARERQERERRAADPIEALDRRLERIESAIHKLFNMMIESGS